MKTKTILVTPGDPAGIGPEITWKSLFKAKYAASRRHRFVCVGALAPFLKKMKSRVLAIQEEDLEPARLAKLPRSKILILPAPEQAPSPGLLLEGYQCGWAIKKSVELIQAGKAAALVTGPISKERLRAGGFHYSGHTDFLADLCGITQADGGVTMMLANSRLRITLVTVHIALKDVPAAVTEQALSRAVLQTADSLRRWWGIRSPRIGVAALNPHAGENGIFGNEEQTVIEPALKALRAEVAGSLVGPLPADTLFANHISGTTPFDAVVCMYHDQGLIPVKLLDFQRTVNVTLGLPIVRTSVDHGVAFDIAGKNQADPSSLQSALDEACRITAQTAKTANVKRTK
ncbi:MAG: 4-hydroxythreonine-4-phosphate dehydrogenase PdxA [Oligoflexia bacterium]|nr:4-hydroxythreonine-4-phosphate dehydrogenase PdxA [Oligoflexia bacterium]